MSKKEQKPVVTQEGELSEQQLDGVSGGQEVVKMEKMVITAKREQPQQVVKLDKVVVTAKREQPSIAGVQVAQADTGGRKN
jgi:hypothetical protein